MSDVFPRNQSPSRPLVHIGHVVQCATFFNHGKSRGAHEDASSLESAVEHLFSLLERRKIDYLLVGGLAMLVYVDGRNTEYIDLILTPEVLATLPELAIESRDQDFAKARFEGLRVDLLLTTNALFDHVRQRYATRQRFVEREIPCVTVEGLLLLKLYALPSLYRQGSFARVGLYENDIATLLEAFRPDLTPLLAELESHLTSTDLLSLHQILAEIEGRITRFGRGLQPG